MTHTSFKVPRYLDSPGELMDWARLVTLGIHQLYDGKINTVHDVTFTANQATTTITDSRISINSCVVLSPATENAGGEVGFYIVTTNGSATVTHGVDSRTDRTFRYAVLG